MRMYPQGGLIIYVNARSPDYSTDDYVASWDKDVDRLPRLQALSDVGWLAWQEATNEEERSQLRWILRKLVVNPDTLSIVQEVIERKFGSKLSTLWPDSRVFTPADEEFKYLLYTPNMRAVVWMLIQRREDLGELTIQEIKVSSRFDDEVRTEIR